MSKYIDRDILLRWLRNDKAAADYVEMVCNVAHVWDDLIDRDKDVSDEVISEAFFEALIRLPRNPFYRKHFDHLNSVLMNSISNWQVATKLEREGGEYEKSIAFILRSSYIDLVTQSALLIADQQWACQVGEEARRLTHGETYVGYLQALADEEKARKARQLNQQGRVKE